MKFLADENIPLEVVFALKQEGVNVISLSELRPRLEDKDVLKLTNKEKRVLITFDTDFGELIFKQQLTSHGVILLRIHPQTVEYIIAILNKALAMKIEFEKSFCVVEANRIRIIPLNKYLT